MNSMKLLDVPDVGAFLVNFLLQKIIQTINVETVRKIPKNDGMKSNSYVLLLK